MKKLGRPLKELIGLKPAYIHQLSKLWLTTVEDIAGIIRLSDLRSDVSKEMIATLFAYELGISIQKANEEILQVVRASIPDSEWYAIAGPETPLYFGLLLEELEEFDALQSSKNLPEVLPNKVNLLTQFPHYFQPIHDQKQRGTCVAFAVTTLNEYVHSQTLGKSSPPLSEEFLYWAARNQQYKSLAQTTHRCGTRIEYALQALINIGQCKAVTAPYQISQPCNLKFAEGDTQDSAFQCSTCDYGDKPAYLATGILSENIISEAKSFQLKGWQPMKLSTVHSVKAILHSGYPVVLGANCYLSWLSPTVRHNGTISLPFERECDDYKYHLGAHAMLAIGYEDDDVLDIQNGTPGGGYFIVRNSWGKNWGERTTEGCPAGYGKIPYAYLTRHLAYGYTVIKNKQENNMTGRSV